MNSNADPGLGAVQQMAQIWEVDADRVKWFEGGFDWWPGSFKVSVRASLCPPNFEEERGPAWRITVRTDLLKGVRVDDSEVRTRIARHAALCTSYGCVYAPPALAAKYPEAVDRKLWLQSTAYLRPDTAEWLPRFFAGMTILQPIDAQRHVRDLANSLGGEPDISVPGEGSDPNHIDDMLNVIDSFFIPQGQDPNAWDGCAEFEQFAEQFGRNDDCFGNGDPTGLTLETPFGEHSTLIQLLTTEPHPFLGAGLLASLLLPVARTAQELESDCAWFNYFESTNWTGFPQLGSWSPARRGSNSYPGAACFLPNGLHMANLANNAALWHLGRVRWVKKRFFPDLQDRPMIEILTDRQNRSD